MATEALSENAEPNPAVFNEMLPVDPFRSLYVHFGMLLGVDDFQTQDAYHRGKAWFHSAWLHGTGVVWGYEVTLPLTPASELDFEAEPEFNSEVRVSPGLAIDAVGRELNLAHAACLNIADWYHAHQDDEALASVVEVDEDTGDIIFNGHVKVMFRTCLSRQVPAMSEPCDGSSSATAYSRAIETVYISLLPGLAENTESLQFYRLQILLGLAEPRVDDEGLVIGIDQDVVDARFDIDNAADGQKAEKFQQWFRHFAILEQMDMAPESEPGNNHFAGFPRQPPGEVVLANLHSLRLHKQGEGWQLIDGEVDNFIRPYLLPTGAIQQLICDCVAANSGSVTPAPSPGAVADAGGPRIDPDSVKLEGTEMLHFNVIGGPLMKASADLSGLSLSAFDTRDGWIPIPVKGVHYDASKDKVSVEFRDAPGGNLIRLIVKGTGPSPFLGRNRIPLAGGPDSGPGSRHEGNDFVHMFKARSGS